MRKLVIGGLPRSGSTLLRLILDASGQFVTLPETNFFTLPLWQRSGRRLERYAELIASKLEISPSDIVEAVHSNTSSIDAFEAIVSSYAKSSSLSLPGWCEKSPPNCFHYNRISYEDNNVLFISTIRNGLDVMTSIIDGHPKRGNEYWCSIQCYIDSMAALMNFKSERHFLLRYEDLVTNPVSALYDLSNFLGVDLPKHALTEFNKASHTRDFTKLYQSKVGLPLTSSWVGRWKDPKHENRISQIRKNEKAMYWQQMAGYEVN